MKSFIKKLVFRISLVCLLFSFTRIVFSQNLVPNPSFEQYINCSDVDFANCANWLNPTQGSPDYYNTCHPDLNNLIIQYQLPYSGNAYIGIYGYQRTDTNVAINVREYIQAQLTSVLNSCFVYDVSFYASLRDPCHFAISNLSALLNDSLINTNDYYCLSNYDPQINNQSYNMLSNKTEWTKIHGKFVAQGNEKYITIGNFNLDNETNFIITDSDTNLQFYNAYYFIDSISLTPFSDASMPANAGPDIDLTEGDSIFIGQEISNLNCTWSILGGAEIADSISGIYVQPTQNTTYVAEQNLCGVTTYDTVTVFVHGVGLSEWELVPKAFGRVLSIFPNPSNGKVTLKLPQSDDNFSIKVVDVLGREVNYTIHKNSNLEYEIELLAENGLYQLIRFQDGFVSSQTIEIQK